MAIKKEDEARQDEEAAVGGNGERQPLLPPQTSEAGPSVGPSTANTSMADTPFPTSGLDGPREQRPRTVRHHRRTMSGRSIQSGFFGPSYGPGVYPAVNDPFTRQAKRAADKRARSRFLKSLAVGLGLWLLIGVILGWTGFQEFNGRNRLDYGGKPSVPPSEGTPYSCANFTSTDDPFSAPLPRGYSASGDSFSIPVGPNDTFFIHGTGSFAKGRLTVEVVDDSEVEAAVVAGEQARVKVDVEARYNDARLPELMQVCEVRGDENGQKGGRSIGLGLYTPTPEVGPYPDEDLDFAIRIRIPTTVKELYTFEIRGKMFSVRAGDLTSIDLDRVDFETSVALISLDSVHAHAVRIRSHNGAISGHFNVSRSLSLASSNGAVRARVALFPRTKEDDEIPELPPNPPSDGVPAPPGMVEGQSKGKGGDGLGEGTTVHATTTNGAVDLEYVEHPVGQVLYSYAASTNGKVVVTHTPAFEGDFEAETTWGTATISGPDEDTDPAGKGRKRSKEIRTDRKELGYRHIVGTVWWSEEGKDGDRKERGETTIKTTLGSARIDFL